MTEAPAFASRLQDLASEAGDFTADRMAQVREHLAAADALIAEIRAAGVSVTTRFPIGVRDRLSFTRFEFALRVDVSERHP